MTIAQQRIADCINHFYEERAPLAKCGLHYKESANTLDEEVRVELVCQTTTVAMDSQYHRRMQL